MQAMVSDQYFSGTPGPHIVQPGQEARDLGREKQQTSRLYWKAIELGRQTRQFSMGKSNAACNHLRLSPKPSSSIIVLPLTTAGRKSALEH